MSITAIFAALLGKSAASAAAKAIGGKAAAGGAKAAAHHAHRSLGSKVAGKLIDEAKSEVKDAAVDKAKASIWGRKRTGGEG